MGVAGRLPAWHFQRRWMPQAPSHVLLRHGLLLLQAFKCHLPLHQYLLLSCRLSLRISCTGATAREEEDEALPPPPPPGRERESKEERAERMRREEIRSVPACLISVSPHTL